MHVTFDHATQEAPTITTFWFKPPHPVQNIPGQYIELTIHHENPDSRGEKRWFTLSSSPTDSLVSITTRLSNPGSTFKQALQNLKAGDEVIMSEPMGDFVLPKDSSIPLTFVGGGIGLTPFHSILRWLADMDEQRDIRFLYAVRSEDDIIFQDSFEKAGVHATIIVGEPSEAWGGERGQITAEQILKLAEPANNGLIYISGPEPMVEQLNKDLHKLGIPKHRLVGDYFPNYENIYSN